MPKKVVLHIGWVKTGTTTLQKFLQQNASLLKYKGFAYPSDDEQPFVFEHNHAPLVASFETVCPDYIPTSKFFPHELALRSLRDFVEKSESNVIISSEHFCFQLCNEVSLKLLRAALEDFEVRVVVYLRRVDDLAYSLYSTEVLCGRSEKFDLNEIHPRNNLYDFRASLSSWAKIFGSNNIIIRNYEKSFLVGEDIRTDFLSALDIDPTGLYFGELLNESMGHESTEIMRRLNTYLPIYMPGGDQDAYREAMDIRLTLRDRMQNSDATGQGFLSERERDIILSRFREDFTAMAGMFPNANFLHGWQVNCLVESCLGLEVDGQSAKSIIFKNSPPLIEFPSHFRKMLKNFVKKL